MAETRLDPALHGMSPFSSARLTVALGQLPCADGDTRRNVDAVLAAIPEAAGQGADLVLFPEEFLTGFSAPPTIGEIALARSGWPLDDIAACAREHNIGVAAGFAERDGSSLYNTTVLIDKRGEPLLYFRKTHLWLGEAQSCALGRRQDEVVEFEGVKVGVLTCYDVEFPEAARCLGLAGAELILVPTGNMYPWEHRHRVFIMARAIENHAFVAYCNRADCGAFYNHTGDSAVIDPFGRVVHEMGAAQGVASCTLHMSLIGGSKREMDYFHDRRPELYGSLAEVPDEAKE
jgi:(R)-amidase